MCNFKLLLTVIIITALFVLTGCASQSLNHRPKAENGTIDLTRLQFENDVIQLDGEWEFYWNQLISPTEIDTALMTGYINVPSSWNNYITDKGTISGDGYATYRLTFVTDKKGTAPMDESLLNIKDMVNIIGNIFNSITYSIFIFGAVLVVSLVILIK